MIKSHLSEISATLPLLLNLNAGDVDAAGFLVLQGLFTAHVTVARAQTPDKRRRFFILHARLRVH